MHTIYMVKLMNLMVFSVTLKHDIFSQEAWIRYRLQGA
jgi:hypothetical protein